MVGSYTSPELTLELREEGGELRGELTFQGARMPVRAAASGAELRGSFRADDTDFPFSAVLQGDQLRLESGGAEYLLQRQRPARANPLAARAAGPAAPPEAGQLFRHPTGGEFRVPPGWSAQPTPAGVQLVPPNAAFGPTGPAEIYLVSAEAAPGIDSAGDPRVLAYLDQSVAAMIPGAVRAGAPEPAGSGLRLRWTARHPMTGGALEMVTLVTLLRGIAVGVSALGEPAMIAPRLPAVESVFASLNWGKGDLDPALVGVWHYWSYSSSGSSSYSGASTSAETRRVYQLAADGTARMRSNVETSANLRGRDGHGDETWTAGYAGQGGDERAGTWSAGGGMLYIMWQDGQTATFQYRVTGPPGNRQVMLQTGRDKPFSWTERPVQV